MNKMVNLINEKFEITDNLYIFKIIVDIKDFVLPFSLIQIREKENSKENISYIFNLILKDMIVKSFTIEKL